MLRSTASEWLSTQGCILSADLVEVSSGVSHLRICWDGSKYVCTGRIVPNPAAAKRKHSCVVSSGIDHESPGTGAQADLVLYLHCSVFQ